MQLTSNLAGAAPGAVLTLSTAAVFLYGGHLVINGTLSLGGLVAFMAYHMRLLAPVQSLLSLYTGLATARVSLGRVFELLDTPIEVLERTDAAALNNVRGEVTFADVTLRHDRQAVVLNAVSFNVPAGSLCAIVGPSGVGKSTIADLMLRLYDPESGIVKLDGREVKLADLRAAIALVDQQPFLFNASIAENIAYARPTAKREEIIEAARAAAIDGFIAQLPAGYETEVGERGLALSAGERQRLAIARAWLRQPAVLVLDEPTAALDPATEQSFVATLAEIKRGRTVIVITHRLALAELADQIIVLEQGRVVEAGPPEVLLAGGSRLSQIFKPWERQDQFRSPV